MFAFIIILITSITMVSSGNVVFNAGGEWYSTGFSTYAKYRGYIESFLGALMEVRVIDSEDGSIWLSSRLPDGTEFLNNKTLKYDNKTGSLNYHLEIDLPWGETKVIDYNLTINGSYDFSKYLKLLNYSNKTIEDIILDLRKKDLDFVLVGKNSNITLETSGDGPFSLTYERNIEDNESSPILEEYDTEMDPSVIKYYEGTNSTIGNSSSLNNSTNSSLNQSNGHNSNLNTSDNDKLVIINPQPSNTKMNISLDATVSFSIDNKDYDKVYWKLDGKIVKENSSSYKFDPLKVGTFKIEVDVRRKNEARTNTWSVGVSQKKGTSSVNWGMMGIIFGIIALIILVLVWFFVIRTRKSSSLTENTQKISFKSENNQKIPRFTNNNNNKDFSNFQDKNRYRYLG